MSDVLGSPCRSCGRSWPGWEAAIAAGGFDDFREDRLRYLQFRAPWKMRCPSCAEAEIAAGEAARGREAFRGALLVFVVVPAVLLLLVAVGALR